MKKTALNVRDIYEVPRMKSVGVSLTNKKCIKCEAYL
jgi:hypothetical protein